MKKILALVLGLIMLAGLLAGCGAETPSESNAPASEPPPRKLRGPVRSA